jgi:hypothetical protein
MLLEPSLLPKPDLSCPHCWGMGEVIREGFNGRLFCWPCPTDCPPPIGPTLIKSPRMKGLKGKSKHADL